MQGKRDESVEPITLVPAGNHTFRSALHGARRYLTIGLLLCTGSAGCGGSGENESNGDASSSCSETRCDGEWLQCANWYALDRDDCLDECNGSFDILGCLENCYNRFDGLAESVCGDKRDRCEASDKVKECWDETNESGECVGTSEISCEDFRGKSACQTVAGCDARGTYIEVISSYSWFCEGEPAECSTIDNAAACRALRCTWR